MEEKKRKRESQRREEEKKRKEEEEERKRREEEEKKREEERKKRQEERKRKEEEKRMVFDSLYPKKPYEDMYFDGTFEVITHKKVIVIHNNTLFNEEGSTKWQ